MIKDFFKSIARLLIPIFGAIIFPILLFLFWYLIDIILQNIFHIPEMRQDLIDFIVAFLGLGGLVIGLVLSLMIVQKYFSINTEPVDKVDKIKATYLSTISLIFVNMIPLLGVIYLKWSVHQIIYSYWLESFAVGFYNLMKIKKILKFRKYEYQAYPISAATAYLLLILLIGLIIPFLGNSSNYLSKIIELFSLSNGLIIPFIGFMVSHGFSYKLDFIDKLQYQNITPQDQAIQPIFRLTAITISVIFGLFMYFIFNTSLYALLMLLFFKIMIDIWLHLNQYTFYKFWVLNF